MLKRFCFFIVLVVITGCSNPNKEKADEYFGRGTTLMQEGNYSEAITYLQLNIQYDKSHYQAYNLIGNCYDYLGEYDNAIESYRKANDIEENAVALNNLGNSYCNKGQYMDAVDYYKKAVDIDPKFGSPWYNMGKAYLYLNMRDEGMECIKKAAKLTHKAAQNYLKYNTD